LEALESEGNFDLLVGMLPEKHSRVALTEVHELAKTQPNDISQGVPSASASASALTLGPGAGGRKGNPKKKECGESHRVAAQGSDDWEVPPPCKSLLTLKKHPTLILTRGLTST